MIKWERDPDGIGAKVLGHELYAEFWSSGWSASIDGEEIHSGRRYKNVGRAKRVCLQAIGAWEELADGTVRAQIAGCTCTIGRRNGRYLAGVDGVSVEKKDGSMAGFSIQDEAKRACIRHIVSMKAAAK
jgi:hypothetical protein